MALGSEKQIGGRRAFLDLSCVVGTFFDVSVDRGGKDDIVLSGTTVSCEARALLGMDCRDNVVFVACSSLEDPEIIISRLRSVASQLVMKVVSVVDCGSAVD